MYLEIGWNFNYFADAWLQKGLLMPWRLLCFGRILFVGGKVFFNLTWRFPYSFDWCMDGICRVVLLERLEGRGCFFGRMQLLVVIHSVALATTQLLALHVDDWFFPIKNL